MQNCRRQPLKPPTKRAFTLIEIMVALVLLGLVAALTAVHIKKVIDHYRFEGEIATLFTKIQEAQLLSAAYQTDISLKITRKDGCLYYSFSTEEPFTAHQLSQDPVPLRYTASLQFRETTGGFSCDIFSGGRIEPRGCLGFFQTANAESEFLWFDLQRGNAIQFCTRKPPLYKPKLPEKPRE